jgi:hypothetical protein
MKRLKTKILAYLLFFLLINCFLYAAEKQIIINITQEEGQITHNALGFLHTMGKKYKGKLHLPEEQDEEFVKPLNIKWHRISGFSATLYVERIRKLNPDAITIVCLSDGRYPQRNKPAPWKEDYSIWKEYITKIITNLNKMDFHPIYDVWNEPEGKFFIESNTKWEGASWERFYETYLFTHKVIKNLDPKAKITGPSLGAGDMDTSETLELLENFKDFCVENKCLPDYWNYHFPLNRLEDHILRIKSWNLPQVGLLIPEYSTPQTYKIPAAVFERFAYFESFPEVFGAMRATWANWGDFNGDLGGTLQKDVSDHAPANEYKPYGVWWAYKAYAEMNGKKYKVEKCPKPLSALAAKSEDRIRILIGNHTFFSVNPANPEQIRTRIDDPGEIEIIIKGIKKDNVKIILQEIIQPGTQKNNKYMYEPVTKLKSFENKKMIKVNNGSISIKIDWVDKKSGWVLDLMN